MGWSLVIRFRNGWLKIWVIVGALVSAGTLLAISMITGEKFPWGLYIGFMVGWIIGTIGLSRINRK